MCLLFYDLMVLLYLISALSIQCALRMLYISFLGDLLEKQKQVHSLFHYLLTDHRGFPVYEGGCFHKSTNACILMDPHLFKKLRPMHDSLDFYQNPVQADISNSHCAGE